jgi:hypothetical protein
MNWALLARFSDGNAGLSINIVANFWPIQLSHMMAA